TLPAGYAERRAGALLRDQDFAAGWAGAGPGDPRREHLPGRASGRSTGRRARHHRTAPPPGESGHQDQPAGTARGTTTLGARGLPPTRPHGRPRRRRSGSGGTGPRRGREIAATRHRSRDGAPDDVEIIHLIADGYSNQEI